MLVTVHNRHNSGKVNRKVRPRPKYRHYRLHLLPSQRLRHLLFMIFILLRQLQQPHSHGPFHCGLVPFFLSSVPLPRMQQMGINTVACGRLSHLVIPQSLSSLFPRRVCLLDLGLISTMLS
jgi:hypothetical protein